MEHLLECKVFAVSGESMASMGFEGCVECGGSAGSRECWLHFGCRDYSDWQKQDCLPLTLREKSLAHLGKNVFIIHTFLFILPRTIGLDSETTLGA